MPTPPNPNAFDKVNFVTYMWTFPCDAPLNVLVETARPAALRAVFNLACWSFTDVARWFFKPVALRRGSHFHGRRNRSRGRRRPSWDNRFRQIVPGMSEFGARRVSTGVYTLWKIDGLLQKWFWWMILIDVTTDFFYEWTTILYKTEYCQAANAHGAYSRTGDQQDVPAIGDWVSASVEDREYGYGTALVSTYDAYLGAGPWVVSFASTPLSFTRMDGWFQVRLKFESGGFTQYYTSPQVSKETALADGCLVVAKIPGPGQLQWQVRVSTGFVDIKNDLWLYQGPSMLPAPDKYDCDTIPIDPPPIGNP